MRRKEKILKLLSGLIARMYLKDVEAESIYRELSIIDDVEDDLEQKLYEIYNYFNISGKCENFVRTILEMYQIYDSINLEKITVDEKEINRKLTQELRRKDEYIFEKMTYPLYIFIRNLYYELLKDGAKTVYFFAREGQFLKRLFDTFQESVITPKIETKYLYVSRASTFLGTLKDIDEEEFDSLFHQYPHMSLKVFCQNISFSEQEIKSLSEKSKMEFEKQIYDIRISKEFKYLINMPEFIKIYDQKRKQSRQNFIKYLHSLGEGYEERMFVVDVGWKGSIQNNIQKILSNTNVCGYYLGLVNYESIDQYLKKKAVLFEYTPEKISKNGYLYNSNRSIFEILLGANHGSTINYSVDGDRVLPVLNNIKREEELYKNKIQPIQENIYKKFKKLIKIIDNPYYENIVVEKMMNQKFFELIFHSNKRELDEYNSFYHFENFGTMEYSTFKNAQKVRFYQKIKNYIHFHNFIRYDHTWQYLKLYNHKMHLGKIILYLYKKNSFKKNNLI